MSEPSVLVRLARPDEYAKAGDLTVETYVGGGFVSPTSTYVPVLRNAADRAVKGELLVAEITGELVGAVAYCVPGSPYAQLAQDPDEAEIRMLAVGERARGKGVGQALVHACLDRARTAGLARVRLASQPGMRAAQRMYERMGFTRTPERDYSPAPGFPLMAYVLPL
ncbi:GNAT family N-acetyltransferase [Actinomadura rudentiformis]|uniref:GNAT family N-acetyltransferase n=1 Tax=Actinomadura rudentiformis TaxID=359158 RepID=A0A6H9YMG5_9ACTN|nr:GNAT family N-acetyltransferase [Actinomadura rudentiformis]KAB2343353.1 GNAT family N-acetyltransferase [Actinomadura rudentiformis]